MTTMISAAHSLLAVQQYLVIIEDIRIEKHASAYGIFIVLSGLVTVIFGTLVGKTKEKFSRKIFRLCINTDKNLKDILKDVPNKHLLNYFSHFLDIFLQRLSCCLRNMYLASPVSFAGFIKDWTNSFKIYQVSLLVMNAVFIVPWALQFILKDFRKRSSPESLTHS